MRRVTLGAWQLARPNVRVLAVVPTGTAVSGDRGSKRREFVVTAVADRPAPFPLVVHPHTAITTSPCLSFLPADRAVRLSVRTDDALEPEALTHAAHVLTLHDFVSGARTGSTSA